MAAKKRPEPPPPAEVFLVQRQAWENAEGGFCQTDSPTFVPLAVFQDRKAANAERRRLEEEARRELCPFRFGYDLGSLTNLDEETFLQRVVALDLPAPRKAKQQEYLETDYHWRDWWDAIDNEMTDAQRAGVWALCDRLKFYKVVPLELED